MDHLPPAMLIDLDDTIISAYNNPGPVWLEVARGLEPQLGGLTAEAAVAAITASADRFWDDAQRHKNWRLQLFGARREVVRLAFESVARDGGPVIPDSVGEDLADRYSHIREARYEPFPGALETLAVLHRAGILLGLVTNGSPDQQRPKIEKFGIDRYFHHIQIEGEQGFGKPEERAYRHALSALGVVASEAWMVGDNLEWEVAAPQRLGIFGVWHDHAGAGVPEGSRVVPDRIVRSLSELLDWP